MSETMWIIIATYYVVCVTVWGNILPRVYQGYIWAGEEEIRKHLVGLFFWPLSMLNGKPASFMMNDICTPVWVAVERACVNRRCHADGDASFRYEQNPGVWKEEIWAHCISCNSLIHVRYVQKMPSRALYALVLCVFGPPSLIISYILAFLWIAGEIIFGKLSLPKAQKNK
jgi:predicted CxxxxCH...CXXCH cytochrome family protein